MVSNMSIKTHIGLLFLTVKVWEIQGRNRQEEKVKEDKSGEWIKRENMCPVSPPHMTEGQGWQSEEGRY